MQRFARFRITAWGCALSVATTLSFMSGGAHAVSPADAAASEALFNRGRELMGEGRYDEACPKLAESQRLDPGAGTALNLAECYEKQGKTATAWVTWLEAATLAKQGGQVEREEFARGRAKALEPRLPHLTIELAPNTAVAGLRVSRGGTEVREASLGTALPVDPGDQILQASAPGYQTWRGMVRVTPGASLLVRIPPLKPNPAPAPSTSAQAHGQPAAPGAQPAAGPTSSGVPISASATAPIADAAPGSSRRTWGIVLTGVGAGGLVLGGLAALSASALNDDSKKDCQANNQNLCGDSGYKKREDALARGNVATVLTIASTAIVGTGVVLWLTAPSNTQVGATTTGSDARLVVRGSF